MKKSMLLSTIAMIVVVVVALSTATFAWFSAQTSATISGTATISATKEFTVRTWSTDRWVDQDEIVLTTEQVTALAPINGLELVTPGTVDTNATFVDEVRWFTVDSDHTWATKSKGYKTASLATAGKSGGSAATVTSFQVAPLGVAAEATATAIFDIDLGINGQTIEDLDTLNAMNVVLEIYSYKDGSAAHTTKQYIGTSYKHAAGAVTAGADGAVVTVTAGQNTQAESGTVVSAGLTADTATTLGAITATSAPAAGTADYWKVDATSFNKRVSGTYTFDGDEFILVTAYIWLDGYDATNNMMAKAVTVNIGISKQA